MNAVNNPRGWFAAGQDVGALLPVLQAYMGHSSISDYSISDYSMSDTAYHLRLTAQSDPDITAGVQQAIGEVIPTSPPGQRDGNRVSGVQLLVGRGGRHPS